MIRNTKKWVFRLILLLFVVVATELSARAMYFMMRGRLAHMPSYEESTRLRRILPYTQGTNHATVVRDYVLMNGYYTHRPSSYFSFQSSRGTEERSVKINKLGFRGEELGEQKKNVRVLCLGGSTTFGFDVDKSYPEILEDLLNRSNPGSTFEVINGGVEGANAQHASNLLRDADLIRKLQPDVLVINTTWNTIEQYDNGLLVESIDNSLARIVVSKSILAFYSYKAVLLVKYRELVGPLQALAIYLDKICAWAKERDIKVVLVNDPMVLRTTFMQASPNHPVTHAKVQLVLQRLEQSYKGVAVVAPIDFFDHMDFSNQKEVDKYFIDRGHLNEAGYAIEAKAIASKIRASKS